MSVLLISACIGKPTSNVLYKSPETFFVNRVIDGDTIVIDTGERVRLIGINAPEQKEKCFNEAKEKLDELISGENVALEKDLEDKDKYERLLRYVRLDNKIINLEMVSTGFARTDIIEPNIKYSKEILEAENEAKIDNLGCLWSK